MGWAAIASQHKKRERGCLEGFEGLGEFCNVLVGGCPTGDEAAEGVVVVDGFPCFKEDLGCQLFHLSVGKFDKLLIGRRVAKGETCIREELSELHGFVNGVLSDAQVESFGKKSIKLNACHTALCQQGTVTFDDGEELTRCIAARENDGFATEGTDFSATYVENVAMMSQPRQVEVTFCRHKPVAEAGTINEERNLVLLADGMNLFDFSSIVNGAKFGGEGDVHHAGIDDVLPCGVGMVGFQIVVQFCGIHLAVMGG